MNPDRMHVAVVDIGSLKNLGWSVDGSEVCESGSDINKCVDALALALKVGPLAHFQH